MPRISHEQKQLYKSKIRALISRDHQASQKEVQLRLEAKGLKLDRFYLAKLSRKSKSSGPDGCRVLFPTQVRYNHVRLTRPKKGGKFGYATNCVRTEGRKKPPRQGYCSVGWSKLNPSRGHERIRQERCSAGKEASPSYCGRTQAAIYADEKEVGGTTEEEFDKLESSTQS
jgi:hypothetical protein